MRVALSFRSFQQARQRFFETSYALQACIVLGKFYSNSCKYDRSFSIRHASSASLVSKNLCLARWIERNESVAPVATLAVAPARSCFGRCSRLHHGGGGVSANVMFPVQVGQLPRRSYMLDPPDGGRTTLFPVIAEVSGLAAVAFAGQCRTYPP